MIRGGLGHSPWWSPPLNPPVTSLPQAAAESQIGLLACRKPATIRTTGVSLVKFMSMSSDYTNPNTNHKRPSRRLTWPQPTLTTRKQKIIKCWRGSTGEITVGKSPRETTGELKRGDHQREMTAGKSPAPVYTHTCMHTCINTYLHTCMYMCTYTPTYMYMH